MPRAPTRRAPRRRTARRPRRPVTARPPAMADAAGGTPLAIDEPAARRPRCARSRTVAAQEPAGAPRERRRPARGAGLGGAARPRAPSRRKRAAPGRAAADASRIAAPRPRPSTDAAARRTRQKLPARDRPAPPAPQPRCTAPRRGRVRPSMPADADRRGHTSRRVRTAAPPAARREHAARRRDAAAPPGSPAVSPPLVQVTIGRIEVRAERPAAAAVLARRTGAAGRRWTSTCAAATGSSAMSSPQAIAAVTADARSVLLDGKRCRGRRSPSSGVGAAARQVERRRLEPNQLNLFLFQISQQRRLAQHADCRPHAARRVRQPPLALNLSYMLTAYGEPGTRRSTTTCSAARCSS